MDIIVSTKSVLTNKFELCTTYVTLYSTSILNKVFCTALLTTHIVQQQLIWI